MKHENADELPQEIKEFTETRFKRENNQQKISQVIKKKNILTLMNTN